MKVSLIVSSLAGIAVAAFGSSPPEIPIPAPAQIISRVSPAHPRLFASRKDFVQLRERIKTEPQLGRWHQELRRNAEGLLTQAPSKYEIPDGLRLLSVSRRVLSRTQLLALMYQLDDDLKWRDRAWKELQAAANFPDWNPRHFLDTAEMTHAFAVGYDWFHDVWTPEQRATLRTALIEKGLQLGVKIQKEQRSWAAARHNWNQVCNGGMGIGALAVADEAPELAGEVLHHAARSIQLAMVEFAPDGAWAEGPGYWNYATTYNAALLAALESAVGTDFGLSQIRGFADAGLFPIYLTGPLDRTFNYADGGDGAVRAPHLFWLARKFERPVYAHYQQRMASPHPLDLIWFDSRLGASSAQDELPLDKYFRGAEVVTLRSEWNDRNALFVGFKAGDNKANHSHLDLGSFVFDALGKRWAVDLGADNYNLPGFFGKQRWTYYRLRAEGQNSILINPGPGPDQEPTASGRITRFVSTPNRAFAIADLTAAYAKHAKRVHRGVALLDRKQLLIRDEIDAEGAVEFWWFMHTPAQIELGADGRSADLEQDGVRVRALLMEPSGARFEIRPAGPLATSPAPEGQNKNEGVKKLAVHSVGASNVRCMVLLSPVSEREKIKAPSLGALADW